MGNYIKIFITIAFLISIQFDLLAQNKNEVQINFIGMAKYNSRYGADGYDKGIGFNLTYGRALSKIFWIKAGGSKINLDCSESPFCADNLEDYDSPTFNMTEIYVSGEIEIVKSKRISLRGEIGIVDYIMTNITQKWRDQNGNIDFYMLEKEHEITIKTALNSFYKINDNFSAILSVEYALPIQNRHSFDLKTGISYSF